MMRDWDDAYANSAYIPGAEALPALWTQQALDYRQSGVRIDCDVPYGDAPREVFDLIWPDQTPKGLAVFVHGGYWMATDKSMWTHLAEGARAQGWAVCLPSYTLAPDARISQMTQQIQAAIRCAAGFVAGPIRIAGHSAGGHLVTRMACAGQGVDRLEHVTSISGLHDLRPLLQTKMNATLGLDMAEATAESPALLRPSPAVRTTAWVGGNERPEFIRQTQLLGMMWNGFDTNISCHVDVGHDHFSVIEGLKDADSPLTNAFVG
ncbi:acetyl esterase/lipase [Loktanella ponticola]|uniref:Acetyl esterase/lipase n=1 Tax=Yoonia ponticola TaxID=1524255 RepID=A0A7W9BIM6_9RHOB|nr:alpha/beta hydrolase [Yoonia ponticola]MBB5721233.1 acetyl esterase/lipase [Yoonia ponticola]